MSTQLSDLPWYSHLLAFAFMLFWLYRLDYKAWGWSARKYMAVLSLVSFLLGISIALSLLHIWQLL